MRQRALGLAVAIIVCFALVSASGAATTKAQKVTKINVSTRAAVVHYLRSIHVNPKGAVIQRGGLNYAGARCPGVRWTCASTKHTVVQIAKRGGQNRFACRSEHCVVVQISGVSRGIYISGRQLASTAAAPKGGSAAVCVKTGSGATTGTGQSCTISQLGSGPNTAGVYENTQKVSGLTQTAQYTASITQQSTGSNNNTACVTQAISLDGSATNTNGKPTIANLQAHQSILISQDNSGNATSARATNSAQYAATSTGACDTTSSLTQSQTLTSTVTATGTINQQENANYAPCGDGVPGDYANLCLDIEQNQSLGFKCTSSTSCPSSANNVATFTQNSTQAAVANATKGAAVTQTQSTPPCAASTTPYNPPASCLAPGGLVGTINQDGSGLSTATPTQNEVQCEDAATSGLNSCSTTPDAPNSPNIPGGLHQSQYGPVGVGNLPTHHHRGRVLFLHLKGIGQALQHGNSADQYTINQFSTQYADVGAFQQNFGKADCTTDGFCTAAQTTTVNGASTSDGYTAPSIPNLNITCTGNSACVPTPPPDPTLTGTPPLVNGNTTSRSATFTFTDTAKDANFICILDTVVQPSPTCGSPGVSQGKASGSQSYNNLSYGTHMFQVKAVDQSGNKSAAVPVSAFSWTIVPPDPIIGTKPIDPATYGSSTFAFSDTGSGVDFKCQIDSQPATWCNSGSITYSGATVLSSGQHTFSVRAYDSATETVASVNAATYTWVITPPNPSITSAAPPNPDSFGNSYSFTFDDTDTTAVFRCSVDGGAFSLCTSPFSFPNTASGAHSFTVKAYDHTNTYSSTGTDSQSWIITPPDPTISSGPDAQTISTDANFVFADDDSTAKFECNLDGAGYSACPSTVSQGPHTLDLKATDSSGSYESAGSATYSWEVIPYLTFEMTPDGASASWSGTPGTSPITLTTGSDSGTYAQFTIHDFDGVAVSGLDEPTFTTDAYSGGAPRYEIDFSDGNYAFGYPSQANDGTTPWEFVDCSSVCASQGLMSWTDLQSAEGSATVTDALIEADFPANATYNITGFTYDGYDMSNFGS